MAIALLSEGVALETNSTTAECPAPASRPNGSVLRIAAAVADDVAISVNESGWTQVAQVGGSSGLAHRVAVFYKVASSESGDYTVDIAGGSNKSIVVQCSSFSGVDNTTTEDATATSNADVSSTTHDPVAITTVTADAFVEVWMYARGASLGTVSDPSGYTQSDGNGGDLNGTNYFSTAAYIDAGATGSENPGSMGTFAVTSESSSITWAMRPEAGGGLIQTFTGPFAGPFGGPL